MGLDIYLEAELKEKGKYPDHFMNATYLRSSYNPSGFNNIVPLMTGDPQASFYGIFAEPVDDYTDEHVAEDGDCFDSWRKEALPALERAKRKALDIEEKINASPAYYTEEIIFWKEPDVQAENVIALYNKERIDHPTDKAPMDFSSYSRGSNHFFVKGLTVYAAIPCMKWGKPCVSLVCELDKENKEHYAQAAYIASEFCQLAIDTIIEKGSVDYVWSG